MAGIYDLKEVPEGVVLRMGGDCDEFYKANKDNLKWGGDVEVLTIGTKVRVNFNSLGTGVIDGYFIEDGWLGAKVTLDNRPEWHVKQNPDRNYALVFGAEVEVI